MHRTVKKVKAPDKSALRQYLDRGLTQQQIVEEWERKTGVRVSRSAIGMAIARFGLESAHPRRRFEDTVPWTVRAIHRNSYDLRMLRLEHKHRHRQKLTDEEQKRLKSWRKALDTPRPGAPLGAAIFYNPNTRVGFFWVPREKPDDIVV